MPDTNVMRSVRARVSEAEWQARHAAPARPSRS